MHKHANQQNLNNAMKAIEWVLQANVDYGERGVNTLQYYDNPAYNDEPDHAHNYQVECYVRLLSLLINPGCFTHFTEPSIIQSNNPSLMENPVYWWALLLFNHHTKATLFSKMVEQHLFINTTKPYQPYGGGCAFNFYRQTIDRNNHRLSFQWFRFANCDDMTIHNKAYCQYNTIEKSSMRRVTISNSTFVRQDFRFSQFVEWTCQHSRFDCCRFTNIIIRASFFHETQFNGGLMQNCHITSSSQFSNTLFGTETFDGESLPFLFINCLIASATLMTSNTINNARFVNCSFDNTLATGVATCYQTNNKDANTLRFIYDLFQAVKQAGDVPMMYWVQKKALNYAEQKGDHLSFTVTPAEDIILREILAHHATTTGSMMYYFSLFHYTTYPRNYRSYLAGVNVEENEYNEVLGMD
ncbi:MAG: hypothetical protein KDH94_03330, partial [Coxiellaceae bacterium]|nr:hypothetical protein [Coxiellaceae bacterium]